MKKFLMQWVILVIVIGLFISTGYSEIRLELTVFGKFNSNLGFPSNVMIENPVRDIANYFHKESKAFFFDPVLGQKSGVGFGGIVSLGFSSKIALEVDFEYVTAELQFKPYTIETLKAKMESIKYTPYFKYKESGGNIMRFNLNLVYNFPLGKLIPFITIGGGISGFKVEPCFKIERTDEFDEQADLYYDDASALTFNFGLGLKYYFSRKIGLRIEFRNYYSSPKFKQSFGYKWLGYTFVPEGRSVIQRGSHLDFSFNLGVIIRIY